MTRRSPWPVPKDTEHLFAKALLVYGPVPPTGFSVTRDAAGKAIYIVARGKEARAFQKAVNTMFALEVAHRYVVRGWRWQHCQQVGKSWKNLFFKWLWESIDDK